jgi:transcriptional regulator
LVYLPPQFAETDTSAIHELIREFPLGTLITLGNDGLAANHIPFILDTRAGGNGRLLAHVARNNPVWRVHAADHEALVVFQSAEAYISPNWYATKQETHKVVPTWNYVIVHAYGHIVVHDDEKWVRGQAGMRTKLQAASQSRPWNMAAAPPAFTTEQVGQIVGIEIPITRLIGKAKASQNRIDADRDGAIAGLRETGDSGDDAMAEIMASIRRRS